MFENVTMTTFFTNKFCSSTIPHVIQGGIFFVWPRSFGRSLRRCCLQSLVRVEAHPVYTLLRYTKDRVDIWANTCIMGLNNIKDKEKRYSVYRLWNNLIKILGYVGFSRKLWKSFYNFKWNAVSILYFKSSNAGNVCISWRICVLRKTV